MRRVAAAAAAGILGASATSTAFADEGGATVCETQWICVQAVSPPSPKSEGPREGRTSPMPSKGQSAPPPCTVQRLSPQPPADNPIWEGHRPGDGAVYIRVCPLVQAGQSAATVGLSALGGIFWSASTPPASTVDPEVLAQRAVDRMRLVGPDIQSPVAGRKYLVGMPMWMHAGVSPAAFGPNTASASAGPVTVTASARVVNISWSMGEGATVVCQGPGTAYKPSYGLRSSPDCGHVYRRTSADQGGSRYVVSATSRWQVDWNGAGQHGQFTVERTSQVRVSVGELQALG